MQKKTYTIQDRDGPVVPNAPVYVYVAGTNFGTLATGIVDKNGAAANPVLADLNGQATIGAPDGTYDIRGQRPDGSFVELRGEQFYDQQAAIAAAVEQTADDVAQTTADRAQTGLDRAAAEAAKAAAQASEANAADSAAAAQAVVTYTTDRADVRLAAAAALPAYSYAAGVITFTATGSQSVDGIATVLGDSILNPNAGTDGGIYAVTTKGASGVAEVWTRRTDSDTGAELANACVRVQAGNTLAGWTLRCQQSSITLGTTTISWSAQPGAVASEAAMRVAGDLAEAAAREDGDAALDQAKVGMQQFFAYVDATTTALDSGDVNELTSRVATGVFGTSLNYANWSVGFDATVDLPVGSYVNRVPASIAVAADATKVRARLWRRTIAAPGGGLFLGPGSAGDLLLEERVSSVTELGITPGAASPEPVVVSLSYHKIESGYTYLIELDAIDNADARKVLGIRNLTVTSWEQWRRGYYRNSVGTSGWSDVAAGYALAINLGLAELIDVSQVKNDGAQNTVDIASINAAFDQEYEQIAAKVAAANFGLSDDAGWGAMLKVGSDVQVGQVIAGITVPQLRLSATADHITFVLMDRATTGNEATVPGGDASDVTIFSRDYTLAELATSADGVARDISFIFPSEYVVTAGRNVIFYWIAYDASNAVVVSTQGYRASGSDSAGQRGWYKTTTASGYGPINSSFSVCWSLLERKLTLKTDALPDAPAVTRDQIVDAMISATGLSISASVSLKRNDTKLLVSGVVTASAPTSGTVSAGAPESRTLQYVSSSVGVSYAYVPALGKLAHAQVSSVVVTRVSDSAVLTLGADYTLNARWGGLMRAASGVDVPVTVTYSWSNIRYDLLYLDAATLSLGIVAGTEGAFGEVLDRAAAIGASSRIPIAYLRVTATAVEILPVWAVDGVVHRDLIEQWERDATRNARVLRSTLGAAYSGKTIQVNAYGDSIVAMQNAVPPVTTPNGTMRDRASSAGGYIPGESLTLYDFGDGAGAVHTKFGTHWAVANALQQLGSAVEMLNWGIGGTNSSSATNNGLDASRIAALETAVSAAVTAGKQPLVLVHFGMNEIGVSTTEANVVEILRRVYAAGGDALVVGVARRNLIDVGYSDDQWRLTNRALRRAAEYVDPASGKSAGFVETLGIFDDAYNVLGISRDDNCSANGTNHPRVRELSAIEMAAVMWIG